MSSRFKVIWSVGMSRAKAWALSILILAVPSTTRSVEIVITTKQLALCASIAGVGAVVSHIVSRYYADQQDGDEPPSLSSDETEKRKTSEQAGVARNLLALVSSALFGGFVWGTLSNGGLKIVAH